MNSPPDVKQITPRCASRNKIELDKPDAETILNASPSSVVSRKLPFAPTALNQILLGAFLLDLLEHDKVPGLRNYTIGNLESFVNRDGEKKLVEPVINNVKKLMGVKIEKQSPMTNASSEINQHDNLDNQNNADSLNNDLTKLADSNFGN